MSVPAKFHLMRRSPGGSTVWEETFQTEQDALKEVLRTIDEEGIACFLLDPIEKLH